MLSMEVLNDCDDKVCKRGVVEWKSSLGWYANCHIAEELVKSFLEKAKSPYFIIKNTLHVIDSFLKDTKGQNTSNELE